MELGTASTWNWELLIRRWNWELLAVVNLCILEYKFCLIERCPFVLLCVNACLLFRCISADQMKRQEEFMLLF